MKTTMSSQVLLKQAEMNFARPNIAALRNLSVENKQFGAKGHKKGSKSQTNLV